jgi:hypothetical protein
MDNVKLGDKSTIGILDPARVNQTSQTVTLRKESEMYKDMTMNEFNKKVVSTSKDTRVWVSLYIAKTMHTFMKGGKKTIKIHTF